MLKVKELQYKLTESLSPNEDCIQILEDVKDVSPELQRMDSAEELASLQEMIEKSNFNIDSVCTKIPGAWDK